ncbi:hypothetical protein AtubIFM55763_009402 [Aspergillus tubingensis]|uniref:UBL3-like ubiquitin domain-containing protein n=3 Tax=Aspergillus subgen. Circumdati TaxID=2720871 RepID=A0A124BXL4_ASPNG|nr:ubiquitin-like protein [Aspergillus neoniger CBS 115656]XP_035351947.1 ubiquitin-like protein [Aspergillus tubingensis]GAQ42783.1 hypothetical protein ANI_1_570124 [Aspergillus niger]PYH28995.1 ubiquitin-like protein [Aspergillus neoniger CBS 115656]GFN11143.1 ubiquitin-like protein [Aspergillus tubingensis]GLA58386.1 hypothetical protein AtubIFM54640_007534 [Aspergillus tubingensis]GLA69448.1 hypothetical protein AtubIFM55763_009402 [Aspergillus tubingensis]
MSVTEDPKFDPMSPTSDSNLTSQSTTIAVPSSETQELPSAAPHPDNAQAESQEPSSVDAKPTDNNEDNTPAPVPKQDPVDAAPSASASPEQHDEAKAPAAGSEPSSQGSDEAAKEEEDTGPSLVITLLLITGSRHPFKIDGKYLRKRSVNVENYDPFAMSVYTLKELIWREWRQDWEPRPSSPSSIRLISFGKLLDDKAPLSDSKFSRDAPNVVHMTVKPQEIVDEEDAKSKPQYTRERESSERSPGCRCIIQ